MDFGHFKYPSYDEPLLAAYQGIFDSAFVLLHPFRIDTGQSKSYTPLTWAHMSDTVGFHDLQMLNRALLTSIGALREEFSDPSGSDTLETFLISNALWEPTNGEFDVQALSPILYGVEALGVDELLFVPEISDSSDPASLKVSGLQQCDTPVHFTGSLITPDQSFLMTVDWDNFFTVLFGSKDLLKQLTERDGVEGFFATSATKHFWFDAAL